MRRSWAALTVGLTVLVVATVSFVIFKYTAEGVREGGYRVHALFRDALGLTPKSRVLTAGIEIGQLESKTLDTETARARVVIRIQPDIKLYENAVVLKKAASLLGEFYLEIDPGTPVVERNGEKISVPVLKDGDEIKNVVEQARTGEILDSVNQLMPILKDILTDVRGLTSGPISQIANNLNETVGRSSVVLERLLIRVDNIAARIDDITAEEADDVKVSLRNIREITEGVKALIGTSEGTVSKTGEEIRSSLGKIQKSIDTLERSLENVHVVTERLAEGQGTVGKLLKDETVANNIERITDDAGTLIRSFAQLQTIVGVRTEYNFLANTFKHFVSVQLMPRPDKFYLIEIVDDPRGFRREVRTIRDSSRDGLEIEREVRISEQLRFSFMFGKTIGPLTGRFGIKESTGGVGADLRLFTDRLMLSADVFDTLSNVYPRVQGRAAVAVYKRYLYIVGGADDLANYTRSPGGGGSFFDWFLGGSLVFNDEDLKSILIFGGGGVSSASSR